MVAAVASCMVYVGVSGGCVGHVSCSGSACRPRACDACGVGGAGCVGAEVGGLDAEVAGRRGSGRYIACGGGGFGWDILN